MHNLCGLNISSQIGECAGTFQLSCYDHMLQYFLIDQTCIANKDAIPIKSITPNQTIIKGESLIFSCLFEDHYDPSYFDFTVYWKVGNINILGESNHTGYHLDEPKQGCSSDQHYDDSCCLFVSILHINTTVLSDSVTVTCYALHNGYTSSKTTNLSKPNNFLCIHS